MKASLAAIALLFPFMLCGCATTGVPRSIFSSQNEIYVSYADGGSNCYARLLNEAPWDRVCVKGDLVTYGPMKTLPKGFKPMPSYVIALFHSQQLRYDE